MAKPSAQPHLLAAPETLSATRHDDHLRRSAVSQPTGVVSPWTIVLGRERRGGSEGGRDGGREGGREGGSESSPPSGNLASSLAKSNQLVNARNNWVLELFATPAESLAPASAARQERRRFSTAWSWEPTKLLRNLWHGHLTQDARRCAAAVVGVETHRLSHRTQLSVLGATALERRKKTR